MQARCRLGFERRVDAAIYQSASKAEVGSQSSEHGIVATGKHVRSLRPLVRRTACTTLECSRGDEATRPTCALRQQRPYSWPACHLERLSADPTVAAPSLVHAVEGFGWSI